MGELRVGFGFDVHARSTGRPLHLGGVSFEGEAGLVGHSDGDVVCHAIADALLGAGALGDLGEHFPEADPAFAAIAGLDLLARTVAIVETAGRHADGCDVTVICDSPAIEPRRHEMRSALATAMGIDVGRVSVKATRPEGLGLSGDGIGAMAIATIS